MGELTEENTYKVFRVKGYLTFRDGSSIILIDRNESGLFHWRNDHETGTAATIEEAWRKMPSVITDPDHHEKTPIVYRDEIENLSPFTSEIQ